MPRARSQWRTPRSLPLRHVCARSIRNSPAGPGAVPISAVLRPQDPRTLCKGGTAPSRFLPAPVQLCAARGPAVLVHMPPGVLLRSRHGMKRDDRLMSSSHGCSSRTLQGHDRVVRESARRPVSSSSSPRGYVLRRGSGRPGQRKLVVDQLLQDDLRGAAGYQSRLRCVDGFLALLAHVPGTSSPHAEWG